MGYIAVEVKRRETGHQAPVKLIGVGLPGSIQNQTAIIPAGQQKGYLSFYLPPTLPPGQFWESFLGQRSCQTKAHGGMKLLRRIEYPAMGGPDSQGSHIKGTAA